MGRADSIMSDKKECFVCGRSGALHLHHVFGGANRKKSDIYGCWCWLCPEHHTGNNGVHFKRELDLKLKKECQSIWERSHSRDEWFRKFGKSFI